MTAEAKPRAEVWRATVEGNSRPCTKCGRPLLFVPGKRKPDGAATFIPLDLTTLRPAYIEIGSDFLGDEPNTETTRWEARSHFETCPNAADFSRGKR